MRFRYTLVTISEPPLIIPDTRKQRYSSSGPRDSSRGTRETVNPVNIWTVSDPPTPRSRSPVTRGIPSPTANSVARRPMFRPAGYFLLNYGSAQRAPAKFRRQHDAEQTLRPAIANGSYICPGSLVLERSSKFSDPLEF